MFEIGNTLREARLRRRLDIIDCEAETKIRTKYLRAMEEEQFDLMPSPTYVRGFLRTYAEFLGLDGQLVLDEYESRFGIYDAPPEEHRRARAGGDYQRERGGSAPASRRGGRPQRSHRRTEVQLLWLAIGGVMAVALLIWLGVGGSDPATTPVPPAGESSGPAAVVSSAADRVAQVDSSEAPVRPDPTKIVLAGIGDIGCWVEVHGRNEDGTVKSRPVYTGIIAPGESQTFRVRNGLQVTAANPTGLQVTIDGKQHALTGGTGTWTLSDKGAEALG